YRHHRHVPDADVPVPPCAARHLDLRNAHPPARSRGEGMKTFGWTTNRVGTAALGCPAERSSAVPTRVALRKGTTSVPSEISFEGARLQAAPQWQIQDAALAAEGAF